MAVVFSSEKSLNRSDELAGEFFHAINDYADERVEEGAPIEEIRKEISRALHFVDAHLEDMV